MKEFAHAIMFHHFHDDKMHERGQGSISSDEFRKILFYINEKYNLLSPDKFIDKLISKKLSKKDTVLTFDDSLRCQFDVAIPIMEELSIKAFFFVYTNAFSANPDPLEFYRDLRNTCFENIDDFYKIFFYYCNEEFPSVNQIFSNKYNNQFLIDFPFYSNNDKKFRFIRDRILKKEDYNYLMEIIIDKVGYSKFSRKKILFMDLNQLRKIKKMGHNIGMHSSSHPTNIDSFDIEEQVSEYKTNFEFIEQNLGFKPYAMSHPLGRYTKETLEYLKKLNLKVGFRSNLNNDYPRSNLEIPRKDHMTLLNEVNKL